MRLDGNVSELERLTSEIAQFCAERALGEEVEIDLNLALEELFTNAVRHGGCAGMKGAIEIRLGAETDGVLVEFCDRGRAFDPTAAPAPDFDAPLAARAGGGLGLHFVREIMQDVSYRRVGDWNQVRMRRPV